MTTGRGAPVQPVKPSQPDRFKVAEGRRSRRSFLRVDYHSHPSGPQAPVVAWPSALSGASLAIAATMEAPSAMSST